ncbi:hypothetical protein CYY_004141 [Polysphondylium violaceum]|uniref:Enoyl reductase (ER) domain-containing protein n=1 Tax=Polysphondylium violaceum TaxID=133409 RepID=A0A8J4PYQ5_9MYCE|nr:hypothetical protein CYY_004141 [Polysphondylium violaceum]
MAKDNLMKAAQSMGDGDLKINEIPIPTPQKGQVRIKCKSTSLCHTDLMICSKEVKGQPFPRTPGHEVIGVVDKVGEGVTRFKVNDLVGVGFFGGHCGQCSACLENNFNLCKYVKFCGLSYPGGMAEYMVAEESALARVPQGMDLIESAPLMCAGATCFDALVSSRIKAGSLIAIQGVGGLGHLGIIMAKKMGYKVMAFSHGTSKKEFCLEKLGADYYIDTTAKGWIEDVQKLGGAKAIFMTAPVASMVPDMIKALDGKGKLILLSAMREPVCFNAVELQMGGKSIEAFLVGDSRNSEECLKFSQTNHVHPIIEKITLAEAPEKLKNIGKARFRYVIVFD